MTAKVTLIRYFVDCVDGKLYLGNEDNLVDAVPWVIVRFMARAPHVATRMDSQNVLARPAHRRLQRLMYAMIPANEEALFDGPVGADGLNLVRAIPGFIKDLAEGIRMDVCIEDEIELESIDLYGSWEVFNLDYEHTDSKLNAELMAQYEEDSK